MATLLVSETVDDERAEDFERAVPPPEVPHALQAPLPPPPPPSSESEDSDDENPAPRQTRDQIRDDGYRLREIYMQALALVNQEAIRTVHTRISCSLLQKTQPDITSAEMGWEHVQRKSLHQCL